MANRKKGPLWIEKRKDLVAAKTEVEAAKKGLEKALKKLAKVVATDPGDPPGGKSGIVGNPGK